MITFQESYAAILNSWRIFMGDRGALSAFDSSFEGFWRSFGVIVPLAPLYVVIVLAQQKMLALEAGQDAEAASLGGFYLAKALASIVDWIAFPAVMAALANPLNITNRYSLIVVARNWTTLFATLPYAVVALLFLIGVLPVDALLWLWLVALIIVVRLRYQVYSAAIGGPTPLVIGVLVLEFLLSIVIEVGSGRLY